MDPPGGRDERRRQAERLRREEAYYHFINELSEEEYRLMRDSNLLGTPGEVTAEELRQRLDGAKERVSSQPRPESRPQNSEAGQEGSSAAAEPGAESTNGDSLLEWLNTFRRTGNATRSGQSGNQTWRAVSRTNPNSGEFRFSLEININHEQPEPGEHSDASDPVELPVPQRASASIRNPPRPAPYSTQHPTPYSTTRPTLGRRAQARRTRSSTTPPITPPLISQTPYTSLRRNLALPQPALLPPPPPPTLPSSQATPTSLPQEQDSTNSVQSQIQPHPPSLSNEEEQEANDAPDCPEAVSQASAQGVAASREARRTRSRGRVRRIALSRSSRRSRSPLDRNSARSSSPTPSNSAPAIESTGNTAAAAAAAAVEMVELPAEPTAPVESAPEVGTEEGETPASGAAGGVRRHPTIMLDLQVRRIRPGENRDRDSIASRTRSRARAAENTVTFESDSGGFRRTISRSERAGIRTYVSTIRIPLRRISETGLGEPSSTALRSILRQIMTGFGELSSLMETEADPEGSTPGQNAGVNAAAQTQRAQSGEATTGSAVTDSGREGGAVGEAGQARVGTNGRDTNNLVENGTLPILRLAHFFLLNDEEDDEHPRGLTKEQIDNLATRTYGQASLEGEQGRACSVCINEYAQGNKLRSLPCAHEFHIHCIDRWLSENNTCPICRQPILSSHQD
ncbi:E3 ubiquitin-protein ligase RNF6 [Pangasianodon hypophthalmus]|uniref:E3 ubiquitin-protein ligase RNF6 n=1 Tax=Pangasianodon hypophthalmus TaxID=310915 RepID=UPI000F00101B|nr:E3 ubiquitin-protein ligase RNF6 [Pangasianodon hypophthalmus]XP_034153969.2 E3 ubiquitin-protein ligase RNF6 [Pangasianodon hypophthalmus]